MTFPWLVRKKPTLLQPFCSDHVNRENGHPLRPFATAQNFYASTYQFWSQSFWATSSLKVVKTPYCLTKKRRSIHSPKFSTKGCIQINQPPKKEGIIFKIDYYSIHWEKSWRCDLSRALFFHFRAVEELQKPNKVGPKTTYNWLVDVNPIEHICSSNWIMSPILGLTIKIYLKPPAR